ncbi:single strand annealing-weakened 1 [Scheffersomyces xylosifermentans]|uniref:single strand annealing-weakened 1 n=1 Tax=Scheffersomyces xylosifermentans TaxID=1304137 RepID=UPI00315DADF7
MPPQITFVKVQQGIVLPIKIFVNKSAAPHASANRSGDVSSLAINSKSLITLNNKSAYFHIRLSNNYLNSLINVQIRDVVLAVLYETPIKDQVSDRDATWIKITKKMPDDRNVRYRLEVPVSLVVQMRLGSSKLTENDIEFLNEGKTKLENILNDRNVRADNSLNLMRRKAVFNKKTGKENEPVILVEDEDEWNVSPEPENTESIEKPDKDDKKSLNYKFDRLRMSNNVQNCMKVYLISI